MEAELLRDVSDHELPEVLIAFKRDWPKHFIPYQTFYILNEFKKKNCKFDYKIYLYGDYESGVYLLKVSLPTPMHCIYFYTPSNNLPLLEDVLNNSKRIPWDSEPFLLELIPSSIRSLVEKSFAVQGIKCPITPNHVFKYPDNAQLILTKIPSDVSLEFLKEEHSMLVDQNWPHRYPGSELLHKECIVNNFGLGLFSKRDGTLLSSSISNYNGGIFVLFTDPECRGRGYASIIVQQMVLEIRRRSRVPFCTIRPSNTPSMIVFKKIGFQYIDTVDFYRILQ